MSLEQKASDLAQTQKLEKTKENIWLRELPIAPFMLLDDPSHTGGVQECFNTLHCLQEHGLWLCTWCWYIIMFAFFVSLGFLGCWFFFLNITCTAATALGYNRLISSEQMGKVFLLWGVREAVFKSPSCSFCLVGVLHNLWRIQAVSVCSIPANVTYHSE